MVVVTTREFRDKQKKYLDLAENEMVVIKRGTKYIKLSVTDHLDDNLITSQWVKKFFAIPTEYRCNPFEVSASGDLFWADKRNREQVEKGIKDISDGKVTQIANHVDLDRFLDSL